MRRPRICPHLRRALRQQILALQLDAAAHDASARRQQAHDGVAGGGLAAPGLPHQAERLARFQAEADPVDRLHDAGATEADVVAS